MDGNKYDSESDESLMLAYQRGDRRAGGVLYLRVKDQLFGFLYRSCQSKEVAEDLAHDAWKSIVDRIEKYQPTAAFKTYLFKVAHNKLIDYRRRSINALGSDDFDPNLLPSQALTQQRCVETLELLKAIDSLRPPQRDVILLRLQDFSIDAIAEIAGVKRETVRSRLRYAIDHLRSSMEMAYV